MPIEMKWPGEKPGNFHYFHVYTPDEYVALNNYISTYPVTHTKHFHITNKVEVSDKIDGDRSLFTDDLVARIEVFSKEVHGRYIRSLVANKGILLFSTDEGVKEYPLRLVRDTVCSLCKNIGTMYKYGTVTRCGLCKEVKL